jgi:hypothetical protein
MSQEESNSFWTLVAAISYRLAALLGGWSIQVQPIRSRSRVICAV